jgi:hypothetical protein
MFQASPTTRQPSRSPFVLCILGGNQLFGITLNLFSPPIVSLSSNALPTHSLNPSGNLLTTRSSIHLLRSPFPFDGSFPLTSTSMRVSVEEIW